MRDPFDDWTAKLPHPPSPPPPADCEKCEVSAADRDEWRAGYEACADELATARVELHDAQQRIARLERSRCAWRAIAMAYERWEAPTRAGARGRAHDARATPPQAGALFLKQWWHK